MLASYDEPGRGGTGRRTRLANVYRSVNVAQAAVNPCIRSIGA